MSLKNSIVVSDTLHIYWDWGEPGMVSVGFTQSGTLRVVFSKTEAKNLLVALKKLEANSWYLGEDDAENARDAVETQIEWLEGLANQVKSRAKHITQQNEDWLPEDECEEV